MSSRPLEGRVALVTGGGSGLGRAHSLRLAAEGAAVAVNDIAADAAESVVSEIRAENGDATALPGDVSDWSTAEHLVGDAVESFGDLHVLVNNAGNLRTRSLPKMSEAEWDDVVRVHLRGHFAMLRWASSHWRERRKAGTPVAASVVNTTSNSGLLGQPLQASYGAAKAAIAGLTVIAAQELAPDGIRVNAVAPIARTPMTDSVEVLREHFKAPEEGFDRWSPDNVSPLVAYLASKHCTLTGQVWLAGGGTVQRFAPWTLAEKIEKDEPWTVDELADRLPRLPESTWTDPMTTVE